MMQMVSSGFAEVTDSNGQTVKFGHARFEDNETVALVAIEHRDNRGMSVTNAAEQVWKYLASVPERMGKKLDGRACIMVEHYPEGANRNSDIPGFCRVLFRDAEACVAPEWFALDRYTEPMTTLLLCVDQLAMIGGRR